MMQKDSVIFSSRNDRSGNKPWLAFCILACLAALIFFALEAAKPTPPVAASATLTEFSAERAMPHLFKIAQQPHPIGTAENAKVRAYLARFWRCVKRTKCAE